MRIRATFFYLLVLASLTRGADDPQPPIPVTFTLDKPATVSVVIESAEGVRVRNLVSATRFPAGENTVWWDGLDDVGRDLDAAAHGVYHVPGKLVPAGSYRVRTIARDDIDLKYLMTPYFPGDPPWITADRASGWLANHSPPSAVCFIPAGEAPVRAGATDSPAQMLVGSFTSEGGSGIAWIGLDGKKLHGQEWLGGVWTGAEFLARDEGKNARDDIYAYTAAYWEGDKFNNFQSELRLHALRKQVDKSKAPKDGRFGTGEDAAVLKPTFKIEVPPGVGERPRLGGLAAHDGVLVVSLTANETLLFIDARQQRVIGQAKLASPRGVAFDPQGRLLAISGRQVVRFDPLKLPQAASASQPTTSSTPEITLPAPTVVVKEGLDDPRQLLLANGAIYVSDWGTAHRVKVYAQTGEPTRTIGREGTPQVGAYDPTQMHKPLGLALTPDGKLWVAENDSLPKRLSVWNMDGSLDRAYYGPPPYGSGGSIDPADPTRFFLASGGGIEFKLDYATGASVPVAIYARPGDDPLRILRGGSFTAPQTPVHLNGRVYLIDSYNVNPTQGVSVSGVWIYENGRAKPVAMIGQANDAAGFNPASGFSVRWEGKITAERDGEYTFHVGSTHGSRLWIDGKPIVLNWRNWGGDNTGKITLRKGQTYDLVMEIYHRDGPARAQLSWSIDGGAKQVVPASALALGATYFSDRDLKTVAQKRQDKQINFNWGKSGLQFDDNAALRERLPKGADLAKDRVLFAWSDLNDDGRVEPDEISTAMGNALSINFQPDLSALTGSGLLLKPQRFTNGGAPVYDAQQIVELIPRDRAQGPVSSGGGQAAMARGQVLFTNAPKPFAPQSIGGATWSFPSLWPGLHASHIAPVLDEPGQLIGTTRLLGPAFAANKDTDLVAINGNKGVVYLFTADGFFVAQLFNDVRRASWNLAHATPGMSVKDLSLHEECFYPTITRTDDGRVLMQGGGKIIEVTGLDSLRRLPVRDLQITNDDLVRAQQYFVATEAKRQAEQNAPAVASVPIVREAPTVDGTLDEWAKSDWLTIDQRTVQVGDWGKRKLVTAASIRVAGDRLFVAIKTDNPDLLVNRGDTPVNLFKTGGAVDLQLGADTRADPKRQKAARGDVRILVALVDGKPLAMRYTPVAPGTEPVLFSSPVRTVSIDRVDDVSTQVQLASTVQRDEKNAVKEATFELSIPLAALSLKPEANQSIRADIGVLRGNGFQTNQRVYWSNKSAGNTSDIPSEAELLPQLWGTWTFVRE